MTWTLKVENLTKIFRVYSRPFDRVLELATLGASTRHTELVALSDVSLEIETGSTVGIVGRNGAGKSTFLKIVSGNLAYDKGSMHVRGRVSSILELGMGFQPALTGRQNIRVNGLLLGLRPAEIEATMPGVIEFSELGDAVDRPIGTYSSGMKARLAISILTAVNSELVVLDEAFATGDVGFLNKGRRLVNRFHERGITTLLVSHNMEEIESLCDRVIWIDKGVIRADGNPREVVNSYLRDLDQKLAEENRESGVAPTQALLRLRCPAGDFQLGYVDWIDDTSQEHPPLERVRLALEQTLEASVRSARASGLTGDLARRGWGGRAEWQGMPVRDFAAGEQACYIGLKTPQLVHEGELALRFGHPSALPGPVEVTLLTPTGEHRLGELAPSEGGWQETRLELPDACRFETLLHRETVGTGA